MITKEIVLDVETPRYRVIIGRQGEHGTTMVKIDLSDYIARYGDGGASLMVKNPRDVAPYSVSLIREGNIVSWIVESESTITAGRGQAVLIWYPDDGGEAKTADIEFCVEASAVSSPGEPIMVQIEALKKKIEEIQAAGIDNEAVQKLISDYLIEHPIEGITADAVNQLLQSYVKVDGLAQKLTDYVNEHKEELRGPQGDPGETTYVENPYDDTEIKKSLNDLNDDIKESKEYVKKRLDIISEMLDTLILMAGGDLNTVNDD